MNGSTVLVRVSGRDRPGITAGLMALLASAGVELYDVEQVVVRGRLNLGILIRVPDEGAVLKDLLFFGWERELTVDFEVVEDTPTSSSAPRFVVTVIGKQVSPAAFGAVADAIAAAEGNIDRIVRLSRYPVVSYELAVSGGDLEAMRQGLLAEVPVHGVDVAVQSEGLSRRGIRLVVLDMDSTLIQDELVDLLAEEAGVAEQVAAVTERAMAGELDFTEALRERVQLLAGLDEEALDRVASRIRLTPGARTFVRTLKRLGIKVGLVSGGFTVFTERLRTELGLDHAYGTTLEIRDGRLTGGLSGRVVDREAKAEILTEMAEVEGVPLDQVVAVGDGANDLDMLATAGLGIAFNAKPVVREVADTTVSVPFLDAILFLLGIRRDDVDAESPDDSTDPIPVPGLPPL